MTQLSTDVVQRNPLEEAVPQLDVRSAQPFNTQVTNVEVPRATRQKDLNESSTLHPTVVSEGTSRIRNPFSGFYIGSILVGPETTLSGILLNIQYFGCPWSAWLLQVSRDPHRSHSAASLSWPRFGLKGNYVHSGTFRMDTSLVL